MKSVLRAVFIWIILCHNAIVVTAQCQEILFTHAYGYELGIVDIKKKKVKDVATLAETARRSHHLAVDRTNGSLYSLGFGGWSGSGKVADRLLKINPKDGTAELIGEFPTEQASDGLVVDDQGRMFVAEYGAWEPEDKVGVIMHQVDKTTGALTFHSVVENAPIDTMTFYKGNIYALRTFDSGKKTTTLVYKFNSSMNDMSELGVLKFKKNKSADPKNISFDEKGNLYAFDYGSDGGLYRAKLKKLEKKQKATAKLMIGETRSQVMGATFYCAAEHE